MLHSFLAGLIIAIVIGALLILLLITLVIIGAFIAVKKRAKSTYKTAEIPLKSVLQQTLFPVFIKYISLLQG